MLPAALAPSFGQGESMLLLPPTGDRPAPARPAWKLEPREDALPAALLALWGVEPYAEIQAAGLPLPPSPAEVAALPAAERLRHQAALKQVLLRRMARALGEHSRVTRENHAEAAALAKKLGAPGVFEALLRSQTAGLPLRDRYLAEQAESCLLAAYGVDARELRFFVEGCGLSAQQLKELASWLPLPTLFNLLPPQQVGLVSTAQRHQDYLAEVWVRRDLAAIAKEIHDRKSADTAADAMLPALLRHVSALPGLLSGPPPPASVLTLYGLHARAAYEQWVLERTRLVEQKFFGSPRLQALDYLLH